MQLSVCMPSNRPFATSRRAIETALAYCEARDAMLVVSDNSGDAEKQRYWQGRSEKLTYLVDPALTGLDNFLTSIHCAATPFVLPMGDDDELVLDPGQPVFDFSALPADHIGVRPITQVWTPTEGTVRIKDYAIEGETPLERILQYNRQAQGDNSAFYSIFRRNAYLDMMELFARHHPLKAGYCDWAQVTALFAYGKMARDPATIFRYNFEGWNTPALLNAKVADTFVKVGLPADSRKYSTLLLYLDIFVFVSAKTAPLTQADVGNAMAVLSGTLLDGFLTEIDRHPDRYSETIRYLASLARNEQNTMGRFQIALVMANQILDGLKERYIAYYKAAIGFEGVTARPDA